MHIYIYAYIYIYIERERYILMSVMIFKLYILVYDHNVLSLVVHVTCTNTCDLCLLIYVTCGMCVHGNIYIYIYICIYIYIYIYIYMHIYMHIYREREIYFDECHDL